MSFKEKMQKYYTDSFLKKNGDRITQLQGNIISVKVELKAVLWIFHKLTATVLVKPDRSRNIVRCVYKRNRWFKKPEFMTLNQGNLVIVQGLKSTTGKKDDKKEYIQIMNIRNLSTKKDLIKIDGEQGQVKPVRKVRRMK
ncbi:hypothetical protein ACJDT4_14395 [Clostridium neuense]|uniref:Uncharacterized protein n=1 Tax=Clostridium neuense TaxID=1728934 RepID=A0ABW8TL00_9CLOT